MAFTALSFVVAFLSYYALYNLRHDIGHDIIVTELKIMHIFGLIGPN